MCREGQNHLRVVGDKEGEAGGVGDKVLQGGQGNGQAVMGGSAPPQLVHNDQRTCCCTRKDVACLTQLLRHPQALSHHLFCCEYASF